MAKNSNKVNFTVDVATAERLRLLSVKSGYSVAHMIREFSLLADAIPDTCDRIVFMQSLKLENRIQMNILAPLYSGSLQVPATDSDEVVDKKIRADLKKKVTA